MATIQFKVKHQVNAPLAVVWSHFQDRDHAFRLFQALSKGGPPIQVSEFGGCGLGAVVALRIGPGKLSLPWLSEVTECVASVASGACWFVDEGRTIPFGMRTFRHKHLLEGAVSGGHAITTITEDITISAPWGLHLFAALAFWGQMQLRGPVYRRYPWLA